MRINETDTAASAIKFKKLFTNTLIANSDDYGKAIHKETMRLGAYNPNKTKDHIMDWIHGALYAAISNESKRQDVEANLYFSNLEKGTNAAMDPVTRSLYLNQQKIVEFVDKVFSDLTTFVYAPDSKDYNPNEFTPEAVAEGLRDGFVYGIAGYELNKFISTIMHEIAHLIQTKNSLAAAVMTKSVKTIDQTSKTEVENYTRYKNQAHEIDAFANGKVSQFVLQNPDFKLEDISKEVIHIVKMYHQFGEIKLTKTSMRKFASKVFKLLHQIYKERE